MGEAWDDLAAFRRQRAQCATDVSQLTSACARDHPQHKHVLECRECYGKVIDRLRSQYVDPSNGEDDLDELFAAARQYETDLDKIEARIVDRRRRAYAQNVKASPSIRKSLEELLGRSDIFSRVSDDSVSFEELVGDIRDALGRSDVLNGDAGPEGAEKALERLMAVKSPDERWKVYKETFFLKKPDEQLSGKTQMYLDRLQDGATMNDIVNKISLDRRSSIGAMDQKERHKKRIDDIRRARAAHELAVLKKESGRKDSNQKLQPRDEMYDQPPCHACGKHLNLQNYRSCSLCQVLVDAGARNNPTVFCSATCFSGKHGQEAHVEASHDCASKDYCAQIIDEDTDMDGHASGPFVCKECMEQFKHESVFCTMRCAEINFQRHREDHHLPERRRRDINVDWDLHNLVFDNESKTRYHVRDITLNVVPLEAWLMEFQERNSVEMQLV